MSRIKLSILLLKKEHGSWNMDHGKKFLMLYALCSMLILTACGFKPVYGHGTDESSNPKLASIAIEPISSREGQVFRNKLADLLNPNNEGAAKEYKLSVKLEKDRREFGIQKDFRVTRYDIRMTAHYELTDLKTNNVVLKDNAVMYSDFNRTESEFSTFVGEEDAAEKAAEQLAQEVQAKLAAFFE